MSMNDISSFGRSVASWHRWNWPGTDRMDSVLGITKVAEEAGELVGALTKFTEGRGSEQAILDELGDVVIAAAGALRRVGDLLGRDLDLGEVVLDRWSTVAARDYRQKAAA